MKTELILYRQQLVENPKFALLNDYGWTINGATWVTEAGLIRKTNTIAGTFYQEDLLTHGVTYKLKFRLTSRTTGTLTITNRAGGTVHLSTTTNQIHEVDFTADGTDIIFNADATFNGTITNVSLYQTPISYSLDLTDDISIPMNFNIDTIFKVNQRKTTYSNTFQLKGTNNNNKAFNHIYKLNSDNLFNQQLKSRVIIKNSGIAVFDGVLCLDDVKEIIKDGISNITYSVSVTGEILNIYDRLGNKTIRDLDFSEYDHEYSIERIYGSWFNDITINGVTGQANKVTTYTSPLVTSVTTTAISGKDYFTLTFASSHSFVAGDEVYYEPGVGQAPEKYCYDQTVKSVTSSTVIVLNCYKPSGTSGTAATAGYVKKQQLTGIGYWYPCVNNGTWMKNYYASGWLGGTGLLTIGVTYIINTYNPGDVFTNVGAGSNAAGVIFTATGTTPTTWTSNTVLTAFRDVTLESDTLEDKGGDLANIWTATDNYWEPYDFVPYIFLREVWTKMMELINYEYDADLLDTKFFKRIILPMDQKYVDTPILETNTLTMNDWLPKIKLTDILNTVVNMFNYAMITDSDDRNILRLVNRGEFFDNTPIVWTDKLQADKELEIQMMNRNLPKMYHFKYKDSSDYYNTDFNAEFGDITNNTGLINTIDRKYGDYLVDVRSDYLTAENKIESIFEPSVMNTDTIRTGIVWTTTYNANAEDGSDVQRATSNRLLLAGMRAIQGASFNLVSQVTPLDNVTLSRVYPCALHLDNHFQAYPTHDLNWGTPLAVYFDTNNEITSTIPTDDSFDNNALYKKYWRRYIEAVSHKDAKVVKGEFKLSVQDIYDLDFQYPIRVSDFILKLNKINGWDVNGNGLCKCEFLLKV